MNRSHVLTSFAFATSLVLSTFAVGCAGEDAADDDDSSGAAQGELRTSRRFDLKEYALVTGIVAMGEDARALAKDIEAAGGKSTKPHQIYAGLTGTELALEGDDKKESFGIECTLKEGDSTFGADMCSLLAVIKSTGAKKKGAAGLTVTLQGKLAVAVHASLPRTSPEGLIGASESGSGPVTCKWSSGRMPDGSSASTCTVRAAGTFEKFSAIVNDTESPMPVRDAEAIIDAFF